jgi:hypothetical protein
MTKAKRELINETITGLLLASLVGTMIPGDAFAQLTAVEGNSQTQIAAPALIFLNTISYVLGAVMVVAGIANAKKHADQPASNPLGPAIGKLGAGAAFLSAPTVIGALAASGTATGTSQATFVPLTGF